MLAKVREPGQLLGVARVPVAPSEMRRTSSLLASASHRYSRSSSAGLRSASTRLATTASSATDAISMYCFVSGVSVSGGQHQTRRTGGARREPREFPDVAFKLGGVLLLACLLAFKPTAKPSHAKFLETP